MPDAGALAVGTSTAVGAAAAGVIEAATRRMDLPLEKFMVNIDRYGNTSSASIPIALHEALATGRIQPGDVLVLTGFGAGLTWGAVVLRWGGDNSRESGEA